MSVFLAAAEFASFLGSKVCPCFVLLGETSWYPGTGFGEDCLLMGHRQLATRYLQQSWDPFNAPPLPRRAA